jgi:hypothetical protein
MSEVQTLIEEKKKLDEEMNNILTKLCRKRKGTDSALGKQRVWRSCPFDKAPSLVKLAYLYRFRNSIEAKSSNHTIGLSIKQIITILHCSRTAAKNYNRILRYLVLVDQEKQLNGKINKVLLIATQKVGEKIENTSPSSR